MKRRSAEETENWGCCVLRYSVELVGPEVEDGGGGGAGTRELRWC